MRLIFIFKLIMFIGCMTQHEVKHTDNRQYDKDQKEDQLIESEVIPEFPGGDRALMRHLVKVEYPNEAKINGVEGEVFIKFTVDEEGYVQNVHVVKGAHPLLDKAAVRVVESMPRWKPGILDGKPVPVEFTFPIRFSLN